MFSRILDRENLRLAFHKALIGKRGRPDARAFAARLDDNLSRLGSDVAEGTVQLGDCQQFTVYDPKERLITAPSFRERVLHHAIMNVCEPVLERWLIDDTFACRQGKGRIAALLRAQQFARRFDSFLKLDMRKYFDSISHQTLLTRLERRFKDRRLLALFSRIVESYSVSETRGLPIGSLTSQHFANFYLGWFDRFVKETLRVKGYVRYMDDCVLWGHTTRQLKEWRDRSHEFLDRDLQLTLKPVPLINGTNNGMDFLGCRIYPTHMTLNRRSRSRFRRKLHTLENQFLAGQITEGEMQQRSLALVAFTRTAGVASRRFRQSVVETLLVGGHRARTG